MSKVIEGIFGKVEPLEIVMLETRRGTPDCTHLFEYQKGVSYKVGAGGKPWISDTLARSFIAHEFACESKYPAVIAEALEARAQRRQKMADDFKNQRVVFETAMPHYSYEY